MVATSEQVRSRLVRVSVAAALWGLLYTLYRGYYAAGGTVMLPGTPANPGQFRLINLVATVIVGVAAVLPIAALPLWRRRTPRLALLVVCWAVAVGCCMHALINMIQRALSLAGLLRIEYPAAAWVSIDRRAADLQDLLFNEPWFLLEGLAFGALGWVAMSGSGSRRRWWVGSAVAAIAVLTVVGLLSSTGVIGKVIVG